MDNKKNLYETIKSRAYDLRIPYQEVPNFVQENIRYDFYEWQKMAFENLLTYNAIREIKDQKEPTQVLFNLATGTGKTL